MWDEEEKEFEADEVEIEEVETPSDAVDLSAKEKAIMESNLPEAEKKAYLVRLGLIEEKVEEGIPFKVYARLRKIPNHLQEAMMVWPNARGIKLATAKNWDEIFKEF